MDAQHLLAAAPERLLQLVRQEWSTDASTTSDESGRVRVRCTFGHYQVDATTAGGAPFSGHFDLSRKGARAIDVRLRPA